MNEQELERGLKSRHILMITLGGTIGSGIFKGSSSSIQLAGPGVIVPYLIGGLILFIVMQCMADLAQRNSKARTLRDLVEPILGSRTGYTLGWIYWLNWILVMAAEMAAAASFLELWFPSVPLWILAFALSILMTLLNVFQVKIYGETEFWLASIKIVTLLVFVLLGASILVTHNTPAAVANHLVGHGGFFPHGLHGLVSAMLVVMFSYGGIEMIGMTLGESTNREQTISRMVRGVIIRVTLFYLLPILVIVSLIPWDTLSAVQSPFVTVFTRVGIPFVSQLMNFILLTAVLSAVNTGMYATSRMLYYQAADGSAPKFFLRLSAKKIPLRALLFSTLFLYIGVIVAFFAKGQTFNDLMVYPGYSVLLIWGLIVVARTKQSGMTVLTFLVLTVLSAIAIGVVATTEPIGTCLTLFAFAVIVLTSLRAQRTDLGELQERQIS